MGWRSTAVTGVLVLMIASTICAQETVTMSQIGGELENLSGHSKRAVALLEQLVSQKSDELDLRRLEVAVQALQLRSGAINDLVDRILILRDRVAGFEQSSSHLESEVDRLEDAMTGDDLRDGQRAQLQSSRNQVERQIEISQGRIYDLERQILDHENDLAAKRRDIDALEEIVMEGLSVF